VACKLCDFPDANLENGSFRPAVQVPDRTHTEGLFWLQDNTETISLDIVLPVARKFGEDGAMQGLLTLRIPLRRRDVQVRLCA